MEHVTISHPRVTDDRGKEREIQVPAKALHHYERSGWRRKKAEKPSGQKSAAEAKPSSEDGQQ